MSCCDKVGLLEVWVYGDYVVYRDVELLGYAYQCFVIFYSVDFILDFAGGCLRDLQGLSGVQ